MLVVVGDGPVHGDYYVTGIVPGMGHTGVM